jgi:hypothetical protein
MPSLFNPTDLELPDSEECFVCHLCDGQSFYLLSDGVIQCITCDFLHTGLTWGIDADDEEDQEQDD